MFNAHQHRPLLQIVVRKCQSKRCCWLQGSESGLVRFREASAAEKMLADKADGLKIQNLDASLEKIDEDTEKAFHEKVSILTSP